MRPATDEITAQAEASSHLSGLESDIEHRLSIVERAIRLQMALGATHLQQIEMDPAAFGVPSAARSSVRQLRRERNRALHGVDPIASGRSSTDESSNSLEKLTTDTVAKHSAELIGMKQVDESKEADFAFWGGPFCGECGAKVAACLCSTIQNSP